MNEIEIEIENEIKIGVDWGVKVSAGRKSIT
jgi:hypothetical protein